MSIAENETAGIESPAGVPAAADDPKTRPVVRLLPGRHKRLAGGHPWAFSNEVAMDAAAKALAPGSLVTVVADNGEALGVASFNPHPLISLRLFARRAATRVDADLLRDRLRRALALRERLFAEPYYRLAHAEADGMPGLIIDRYADTLVCQLNTAGMQRLQPAVLAALDALLAPANIVLRNDTPARALEGLPSAVEVVKGAVEDAVALRENGVAFFAELAAGQKTGWFFDQRDNRAFIAGLARGAKLLDAYCYSGGFAVQALAAGATSAIGIDRSEAALALATRAAEANGVAERFTAVKAEVFGELQRRNAAGERFDVVVADPPAFVKSRKDLPSGIKGYRKLARLAAQLVAPEGILLLASCSHHVDAETFLAQARRGIADIGRGARILRQAGAGPDHPVHPWLPESAYLKAVVLALD